MLLHHSLDDGFSNLFFFQLQKMYAKDEEIFNNTDDPITDQITSRWDNSHTK